MGFTDFINNFFGSLRDFASTTNDVKCSQCIKCKQCIKTLSNGTQVRIFTCPGVDDNICDDEYIDSFLPEVKGPTLEYLESYQENRDAIYNYLYNSGILYTESSIPLSKEDCTPICNFNELRYCYKAMECPRFRPFIDTSNIVNDNDMLINSSFPDIIDFHSLSTEDKIKITQRYDW